MVTAPMRGCPGFGAITRCGCPGPAPEGVETAIQPAPLVAVQGQLAAVKTDVAMAPPEPETSPLGGPMLYVQPLACFNVTVCPPMISEPVRAGPALAATMTSTRPLPAPLPPEEMLIQLALDEDVHSQPAAVVTDTALDP